MTPTQVQTTQTTQTQNQTQTSAQNGQAQTQTQTQTQVQTQTNTVTAVKETVKPRSKLAAVKFWGVEGADNFYHTDTDECIRDCLEIYDNDAMPNSLTLVGVAPTVLRLEMIRHSALELLLDNLDEHFGHLDADPSEPTMGMLEAEERFISDVIREYIPSTCCVVTRTTVDVPEWLRIHEPSWLLGAGQ
jgi:hypothetical protein